MRFRFLARLNKIFLALCLALSLSTASAASCVCEHHGPANTSPVSSCHEHPHKSGHFANINTTCFSEEACSCVQTDRAAFAKSDIIKLSKQIDQLRTFELDAKFERVEVLLEKTAFSVRQVLLPEPYYGTSPSRGPPYS
jgi:hypothetical protein